MAYRVARKKLVTIVCSACKFERKMEGDFSDVRDLGEGRMEVGILCPQCGVFVHSYYVTPLIASYRTFLENASKTDRAKAKAVFKKLFEKEQQRIAKELEFKKEV